MAFIMNLPDGLTLNTFDTFGGYNDSLVMTERPVIANSTSIDTLSASNIKTGVSTNLSLSGTVAPLWMTVTFTYLIGPCFVNVQFSDAVAGTYEFNLVMTKPVAVWSVMSQEEDIDDVDVVFTQTVLDDNFYVSVRYEQDGIIVQPAPGG